MWDKAKKRPTLYAKKKSGEFVKPNGEQVTQEWDGQSIWGGNYEENSVRNEAKRENKEQWT
jgi:hypothetical protein